jgi:hypothetical protein
VSRIASGNTSTSRPLRRRGLALEAGVWTSGQLKKQLPIAHLSTPYGDGGGQPRRQFRQMCRRQTVAYFSISNWPCFRPSAFTDPTPSGLIFVHQMAYFSIDKNMNLLIGEIQTHEIQTQHPGA